MMDPRSIRPGDRGLPYATDEINRAEAPRRLCSRPARVRRQAEIPYTGRVIKTRSRVLSDEKQKMKNEKMKDEKLERRFSNGGTERNQKNDPEPQ